MDQERASAATKGDAAPREIAAITGASLPRRRSDVKCRTVEGEVVVLDRKRELVHQLNSTASFVWEQCDGRRTAAQIAAGLCAAFAVEEAAALNDVLEVLNKLQELELIEKI